MNIRVVNDFYLNDIRMYPSSICGSGCVTRLLLHRALLSLAKNSSDTYFSLQINKVMVF